jgi:hypothetical protein
MENQILTVLIIDAETGKAVNREMTDEEIAEHKASQKESKTRQKEQEAKAAARVSALAKLADLGLTQEEINAL